MQQMQKAARLISAVIRKICFSIFLLEVRVVRHLILVALFLCVSVSAVAFQEDTQGETPDVRVVNFPKTQNIDGSVEVKGLIRHSFLDRRERIIVPPVKRNDTNSLTDAGVVQADGFTSIILSLQGEVQSSTFSPGTVGAILVPDEKPIIQAFFQDQTILFPLEVKAVVKSQVQRYFSSDPTKQMVSFPRYRIFLYNSTNKSVEENLYIYLIN